MATSSAYNIVASLAVPMTREKLIQVRSYSIAAKIGLTTPGWVIPGELEVEPEQGRLWGGGDLCGI